MSLGTKNRKIKIVHYFPKMFRKMIRSSGYHNIKKIREDGLETQSPLYIL